MISRIADQDKNVAQLGNAHHGSQFEPSRLPDEVLGCETGAHL